MFVYRRVGSLYPYEFPAFNPPEPVQRGAKLLGKAEQSLREAASYLKLVDRISFSSFGCWLWLLVVGGWLLVVGCWLLVVGCLLFVVVVLLLLLLRRRS